MILYKIKEPAWRQEGLSWILDGPNHSWRLFNKEAFTIKMHEDQKPWVVLEDVLARPFEFKPVTAKFIQSFDGYEEAIKHIVGRFHEEIGKWLERVVIK